MGKGLYKKYRQEAEARREVELSLPVTRCYHEDGEFVIEKFDCRTQEVLSTSRRPANSNTVGW